jgi:hypothetical protein
MGVDSAARVRGMRDRLAIGDTVRMVLKHQGETRSIRLWKGPRAAD